MAVLKSALRRHPYDRELLMTLLSYEIESRDFRSALARGELLGKLEPEHRGIAQLLARLRRQLR